MPHLHEVRGTRVAPLASMNLLEAINARRAVRSYASRKVDDDTIVALLRAAVQAPSAMNAQPWAFAVVQDVARLRRWSARAKTMLLEAGARTTKTRRYETMLRDPSFDVFYDAGTLVAIGAEGGGEWAQADCWLAAQNLMLAACDRGLGTCPIGFAIPLLNTAEVKAELGLAADAVVVAPIIVGYPREAAPPVTRAEPRVVAWLR